MIGSIYQRDVGVDVPQSSGGGESTEAATDDDNLLTVSQAIRSSRVRAVRVISSTSTINSTLYDAAVPNASALS